MKDAAKQEGPLVLILNSSKEIALSKVKIQARFLVLEVEVLILRLYIGN